MAGLFKPDGTAAEAEPLNFKIHEVPLSAPSNKPADIAQMAMVHQRDPVTGQAHVGLGITPATLLVAMETFFALEARDKKIAELEAKLEALDERLQAREKPGVFVGMT